jgi:serpin B
MDKEMSMQGWVLIAMISLFGFLSGCAENQDSAGNTTFTTFEAFSPPPRTAEVIPETADYSALVQTNNELAVQFFQYTNIGLEDTSNASNGIVSAYGLSQTLAMVASGARGTTATEFPLGLDVSADPAAWSESLYALNQIVDNGSSGFALRNAVWGQEGYRFLTEYLTSLSSFFEADLSAYPFKPLSDPQTGRVPVVIMYPDLGSGSYAPFGSYWLTLNDWIAEVPLQNSLVTYPVAQNDPDRTRLVFANTTQLMVDWPMTLTLSDSFEGLFETFDGIQHWVPILRQQGMFDFFQNGLLSAVDLPLGNGAQSLLLITPSAGNYQAVFDNLTQHLSDITGSLEPTEMEVFVPEFTFSGEGELNGFLKSLGFNEVYRDDYPGCLDNCGPDFTGINGQGYLRLETMTRRAELSFASEALNAASVTSAVLEATQDEPASVWDIPPFSNPGESGVIITSCPNPTYIPEGMAHARPFIFVIRDTQTGAILYLGQLTDAGGSEAGSWVCP